MGSKKKKLLREMRIAQAKLPQYLVDTKIGMSGAQLLKHNPKAVDANGKPINPKGHYTVPVKQAQNHYRTMKRLLNEGGTDAVNKYILEMAEVANNTVKGQTDIAKGMQERAAGLGF